MRIYIVTNLINNKIYIGKESRNRNNYFGSGLLINRAIEKYGIINFKKEILEYCNSKDELNVREKYWINIYDSTNKNIGYNILLGGEGGDYMTNNPRIEEIKSKLRKAQALRFERETEEERFIRISKLLGQKRSEETKENIRRGILNANIVRTQEQKNKISDSLKEYFKSEEGTIQKDRISQRQKEKKTDEFKRKISLSMKARGHKPKKLDVHPSSEYWCFYNHKNELVIKVLGDYVKTQKKLNTNHRRIVKFTSLEECLSYNLNEWYHFKVFHEKYYK